jgi:acetylglutamate kinase
MKIIKLGGAALADSEKRKILLDKISDWSKEEPVIVVHGGGPFINEKLKAHGIEKNFIDGIRVTDKKTLDIVISVANNTNEMLVKETAANSIGSEVIGFDIVKTTYKNKDKYGFVGVAEVESINIDELKNLSDNNSVIYIPMLGETADGETLNINADEVAMAVGAAMRTDELIFITDVPGVYDENKNLLQKIDKNDIQKLIDEGIISGGMIPKLLSAKQLIENGVKQVTIRNADSDGTIIK